MDQCSTSHTTFVAARFSGFTVPRGTLIGTFGTFSDTPIDVHSKCPWPFAPR